MNNILEIIVTEDNKWRTKTDGNTNDIIACGGDAIASLIHSMALNTTDSLTDCELYNMFNSRIINALFNK